VKLIGSRYQCSACCEYFNSTAAFDQHRTGSYTPLQRRCLSPDEMRARGMLHNAAWFWITEINQSWPARSTCRARRSPSPLALVLVAPQALGRLAAQAAGAAISPHPTVAILSSYGDLELVADLPIVRDRTLAWVDGSELQSIILGALQGRTAGALVERVSSMPGQGIASSFQFGVGFGSILSVLQALHIRIEFVTAAVWKRSYGLSRDKHASLHKARLLFPTAELHLAKHDGRAESLLLAHYALTRSVRAAA
jgi:hypothetical protein